MPDSTQPVTAPAVTALPPGTADAMKRQQWKSYAEVLKSGKRLSKAEWDRMFQLTQELTAAPTAGDPDWFKAAEEAGMFSENKRPRCSPSEITARVQQVVQWIIDGKPTGFMLQEARLKWGVGYHSLLAYRRAAEKNIQKAGERKLASLLGTVLHRIDNLYDKGNKQDNLQAMSQSIEHAIKVGGLASPVKQVMEFSGPNGGPIAQLVVPERGKLDRDA